MVGKSLGPYKILESLGAGGMGEVFLAEDTRLSRKVAVKVLPPEFATDPERLARFEQEARAAAALNHPHIAAVFDVGAEDNTHFMVQEYLEGETLRDRVEAGPLSLRDALTLGREMAEALAAAHAAGIVHRDLKPENVFVTLDGHAKVLDFGLAKLIEPTLGAAGADATMSPTVLGTMAGSVMGTAGYMAPEQIQGMPVDRRVDLFAFGCVMHEMLTGQRAFAGRTVHQTLDLILSETPDANRDAQAALPGQVRWVLEKCLAKEPARRYQSADDLVVDLGRLSESAAAGTLMAGPAPAAADHGATTRNPLLIWGLPVVTAVAAAAIAGLWSARPPEPRQPTRFAVQTGGKTYGRVGQNGANLAVAPDGGTLVFESRDERGVLELWLRPLGALEAEPIPGTAGARMPFFAPDSSAVGYLAVGALHSVDLGAGVATTIAEVGSNVRGADWGPDGLIVVGHSDDPGPTHGMQIFQVDGAAPEIRVEPEEGSAASYRFPVFLPGGQEILFTLERPSLGATSEKELAIYSLSSGEVEVLPVRGTHARYVPSGHLVFARRGDLVAVPFDLGTRRVSGSEITVVEGIDLDADRGTAQFAVSPAGVLAYRLRAHLPGALAWIERSGSHEILPGEPRDYLGPRLSPDGRRVALWAADESSTDIWLYELERQAFDRFSSNGVSSSAEWSQGGERLIFFSYLEDQVFALVSAPVDSGAQTEPFDSAESLTSDWSASEHPDGKTVIFQRNDDLWVHTRGEGARPLYETDATESWGASSPDGRWVTFVASDAGRELVYVAPYPGPGRPWLVSEAGGSEPVWSRDGQELFYRVGSTMMSVAFDAAREAPLGTPVRLFDNDQIAPGEFGEPNYDVAADGRFIGIVRPGGFAPPYLYVVTDWLDELRAQAPRTQ